MWEVIHSLQEASSFALHTSRPLLATFNVQTNMLQVFNLPSKVPFINQKLDSKINKLCWHAAYDMLIFNQEHALMYMNIRNETVDVLSPDLNESQLVHLTWLNDGYLVTGTEDGTVDIWTCSNNMEWSHSSSIAINGPLKQVLYSNTLKCFYLMNTNQIYGARNDGVSSVEYSIQTNSSSTSMTGKSTINNQRRMVFMSDKMLLLVLEDMTLQPFDINENGNLKSLNSLKFSRTKNELKDGCVSLRLSENKILLGYGEQLRIWDFVNQETREITIGGEIKRLILGEKGLQLLVALENGEIRFYDLDSTGSINMKTTPLILKVPGKVMDMTLSTRTKKLLVETSSGLFTFSDFKITAKHCSDSFLVQMSSQKLILQSKIGQSSTILPKEEPIEQYSIGKNYFFVRHGSKIHLYKIEKNADPALSEVLEYSQKQIELTLHDNLLVVYNNRIDLALLSTGRVMFQHVLHEGLIDSIELLHDNILLVRTTDNQVQVLSIQEKELDMLGKVKLEYKNVENITVNYTGSCLSFLSGDEKQKDAFIYSFSEKEFTRFKNEEQKHFINIVWNRTDERIFHITSSVNIESGSEATVSTGYFTKNHEIILRDEYQIPPHLQTEMLIASVPGHYYLKTTNTNTEIRPVEKFISSYYQGLASEMDNKSIKLLNQFGYFTVIGDIDEAMECIARIKSKSLYRHLLIDCIKKHNIDMALTCFKHLGYIHAVQAIRIIPADKIPLKAAIAAEYLDEKDLAQKILTEAKEYHSLNEFYQRRLNWSKSIHLAETTDRIHLTSTYAQLGEYLISNDDPTGAIAAFEKASEKSQTRIPMTILNRENGGQELKRYIEHGENKTVLKWCAQYMESIGDDETAMKVYLKLSDHAAIVRMFCAMGKVQDAKIICEDANGEAINLCYYHLGGYYESQGNIYEAIHFYEKAKAFKKAIHLAKNHNQHGIIMRLALQSDKTTMASAAVFLEKLPDSLDKAIYLYFKSGRYTRAVQLAEASNDYSSIYSILVEMKEKADERLVDQCIQYLLKSDKSEQAVGLCIKTRRPMKALFIAKQYQIIITESMAEDMLPNLNPENVTEEGRNLLISIAETCLAQKSFALASKKFMQAGNKKLALQALMRSGDTEKVIFFANVSGQKDIYVLAANYLQSCNWQTNKEILKAIIQFYTKARAHSSLALFYQSCAQHEIEEYQDYMKALKAYQQAVHVLQTRTSNDEVSLKNQMQFKIDKIEKIADAQQIALKELGSTRFIDKCSSLIEEEARDLAELDIQLGDVYSIWVEGLVKRNMMEEAQKICLKMQNVGISPSHYVPEDIMEKIEDTFGGSGFLDDDLGQEVF